MSHFYSMGEYIKERYRRTERPFAFNASSEDEWKLWKRLFTEKLHELLGE